MSQEVAQKLFKKICGVMTSPYKLIGTRELKIGDYSVKVVANKVPKYGPKEFTLNGHENRWMDIRQAEIKNEIMVALAADADSGLRMAFIDKYHFVVQDSKFNEYTVKVTKLIDTL